MTPIGLASERQPSGRLIAYGAMAMPLCLAGTPIITYLPAFYAQELRLNVGLVGAVFLCARLWDGLFDLIVGWLSDQYGTRWGRRKPWVLIATPFLMASTWFLCHPSPGAGLGYLVLWTALFYTAWTAAYIPFLSWGAELATDYVERSRVTSYREAFTMLGNLAFAVAPLLFLAPNAPLHDVLFLIALTVLWMLPLAAIPLGLFVRDEPAIRARVTPLLGSLASLAKDVVLRRFVVAILLIWTGEGVINSLIVFAFGVGLQLPDKLFWIIFIIYVATLLSLPLTLRLGRRVEKHWVLAAGVAIKSIGFLAHLWVPMGTFPIVAVLWVLVGLAHASTLVLPTSMLADIIDRGEAADGERRSGAYVALYNLSMKVGLALGIGLSFGLLSLVGYDPAATQHSADDARNIRLLAFVLPALLEASAIVLLIKHPITRAAQRRLRELIESRGEA